MSNKPKSKIHSASINLNTNGFIKFSKKPRVKPHTIPRSLAPASNEFNDGLNYISLNECSGDTCSNSSKNRFCIPSNEEASVSTENLSSLTLVKPCQTSEVSKPKEDTKYLNITINQQKIRIRDLGLERNKINEENQNLKINNILLNENCMKMKEFIVELVGGEKGQKKSNLEEKDVIQIIDEINEKKANEIGRLKNDLKRKHIEYETSMMNKDERSDIIDQLSSCIEEKKYFASEIESLKDDLQNERQQRENEVRKLMIEKSNLLFDLSNMKKEKDNFITQIEKLKKNLHKEKLLRLTELSEIEKEKNSFEAKNKELNNNLHDERQKHNNAIEKITKEKEKLTMDEFRYRTLYFEMFICK